jgi:hypothetical protein
MSLNIPELKASIMINAGRLAVDLERIKNDLTGRGFILKRWYGQHVYKKVLKAADAAAYECAKDLFKRTTSKEQVPVDTGALRDSAYIEKVGKGDAAGYEVGYDKDNRQNIRDKYGIIQHQGYMYGKLINHPNGGKSWFLEDPYNENIGSYGRAIKQAIKGVIE